MLDLINNLDLTENLDSFLMNPITKMGTAEDWTQHTQPSSIRRLSKGALENLSVEPSINRICTAHADSAILKGWEFNFGKEENVSLAQGINDYANALQQPNAMNEAQFLANVYGGAAIVQIVDDGRTPDRPINYKSIRSVRGYRVLDRYKIRPHFRSFENPKDVEYYELILPEYLLEGLQKIDRDRFGKGYLIHRDRILRFDGTRCTPDMMRDNDGWSLSLIEVIYDKYSRYETSLASSAALLKDFSLFLLKMKGWADVVQGSDRDEKQEIKKHLNLLYLTATIFGGMIIDQNDHSLEYPSRSLTEVSEISATHRDAFIGASGMPHTKLFGESPSGLGATGESEERTWAHDVGAFQVSQWKPKLQKAYKIIRHAKDLKERTRDKERDSNIKFHSILQLSEEEILQNRATQAQTDSNYVANQILTREEIRQSRFGGAEYSIETTLDEKSWAKMQQEQQQGFGGEYDNFGFPEVEEEPEVEIPEAAKEVQDTADAPKRIINFQGLQLGIEVEVGQKRFANASPLTAAYGHIRGSYGLGLDGMSLDIYLGSHLDNLEIYQVLQLDPETKKPDEHKYFLAFKDIGSARSFFISTAGKARFGGITRYKGGYKALANLLTTRKDAAEIDLVDRLTLAKYDQGSKIVDDWLSTIETWLATKNTLQEVRDNEAELYGLLAKKNFQDLIEQGNTVAELTGMIEDDSSL